MRRRIRGIKMVGKKFSLDSCMDMVQGLMAEQSLPQCSEDDREDASNGEGICEEEIHWIETDMASNNKSGSKKCERYSRSMILALILNGEFIYGLNV